VACGGGGDDDDNELLRRDADLVARLVGPDAEGCTPSDLAGIEDHTELALFLAEQEKRLILLHVQSKRASEERFPSWLERGTPVAGIGCYHWEAWAGVGRMREAVATCVTSEAN
jgi:hypothetical protein